MPYIGKNPLVGNYTVLDSLTATTTDTYALTKNSVAVYPQTPANCIVSLNGVIQAPFDSYTISGSNIVFASALTASDSIDFITVLGDVLNVGTVSDNTITTAKIQDSAITTAKLNDASVSLAKLTATGTKDSTTFLRGDNSFQTISSDYALLETTTVSSAVGSVTVGNGLLTNSYKFYIIYGSSLKPTVNGTHGFIRVRTSGGLQTASYQRVRMWMYGGSATVNGDASLSSTSIEFALGQSVSSTHGGDFVSYIANPSNTTSYKTIQTFAQVFDSTPHIAQHHTNGAWTGGLDAITGIDYYYQSGNINTGAVFKLFGVK